MIRRIAAVAVLLCLLAACTPGALVGSLDAVVSAVSLALPILSLAGVPGPVILLAQGYLQSVSTAVHATTAELASADTPAVKAVRIASYFAAAIVPNLPAGIDPRIGQLLAAVAQAVQAFLQHLGGVQGIAAGPAQPIHMSRGDKQAVAKIEARNAANIAALARVVP